MVLLLASLLFYSSYLLIELRSYFLLHALSIDLEREKKNQYLVHGALCYGALLYKQHKTVWQLPHTVVYTSVTGERITLEFTQVKPNCIEIQVKDGDKNFGGRCRMQEYVNEYNEPEFELEFKK